MTPFTLETQLAQKIDGLPKETSINGALVIVESAKDDGTTERNIVQVGTTDLFLVLSGIVGLIVKISGHEENLGGELIQLQEKLAAISQAMEMRKGNGR